MRGLQLHAGYVAWWDNAPPAEDALLLRILRRAGALFHARTAEPQGMMQLETDSNLYGTTDCPWNRALSAGGSSGGEGALIGVGGSCLGIGTDIGGWFAPKL
jgi:amidase